MVRIEKIIDLKLGEGPHWDVPSQCLFYVDFLGNAIHRYNPSTKKDTKVVLDTNVSFIIPIEDTPNKFAIGQNRSMYTIVWDGSSETIPNPEEIVQFDTNPELSDNKVNDAKCDALGRLWTGTVGKGDDIEHMRFPYNGSMYSVDCNKTVKKHESNIAISNGIIWNVENTKMYYVDSITRDIYQYDFDLKSGTISNKEVVFSLKDLNIPGMADGITNDSDGNLWVALFNGSRVIQIDPRKKNMLLRTVEMPTLQITSVAFGGRDLDELYVTTGRFPIGMKELPQSVQGGLYKITGLNVKGLPPFNAKF